MLNSWSECAIEHSPHLAAWGGCGAKKVVLCLFTQYLDSNLSASGAIVEIHEDYLLPGAQR